jgi:AcrR family transcriptional regulator
MVADRSEVELAPARPEPGQSVRRRPKDRKVQIIRAAARAFSERGYYPVGVDEIAAEVGISGPALYRHFTNKYALLVAAAEEGAKHLLKVARAADDPDLTPADRLDALIKAISEHTIEIRREAGLYRWERRYLEPEDRARIRKIYDALNATLAEPIALLRPGAPPADVAMLAASVLSAVASISAHRAALSTARLLPLLRTLCWSILRAELPPAPTEPNPGPVARGLPITSKREQLLTEAIRIFGRQGYHEASIEEIGAAVGINASSVYRYFDSKAAIMLAAAYRMADRLVLDVQRALAAAEDPADALRRIVTSYVDVVMNSDGVVMLYLEELGGAVSDRDRNELRRRQRDYVAHWIRLLCTVQSGLSEPEARITVHAALTVINDLPRTRSVRSRPALAGELTELAMTVLGAAAAHRVEPPG